jgi:hypothetical protein
LKEEKEITGSQTARISRRISGEVGGNSMADRIEAMVWEEFLSVEIFAALARDHVEW